MAACSCGIHMIIGGRISPVQIARKEGYFCTTCDGPVLPGQACIDSSYIHEDGGNFVREHAVCHELTQRFKLTVCGFDRWFGGMGGREELKEAAEHAMANGDKEYWREWLELYEESWEFWEDD